MVCRLPKYCDPFRPLTFFVLGLGAPLLILLILHGVAFFDPNLARDIFRGERGPVEILQVLFLTGALVVGLRVSKLALMQNVPYLLGWISLMVLGTVYTLGEEASWGQHFFLWETPDTFSRLNDQNESNLHNISSWFDQKPRLILEIGIIVGGIIYPIWRQLKKTPPFSPKTLAYWIWPPVICAPSAICVVLARIFDSLSERGFQYTPGINGIQHAEEQELFMYLFVFTYAVVLLWKLKRENNRHF